MRHIRRMLDWNEPQVMSCTMFTLLNCIAAYEASLLVWTLAVLMWPTCVCLINLAMPEKG